MVTVVIVLNILIALMNFYWAFRLWQLRQAVAVAADAILMAEYHTYTVLHSAPPSISPGEKGTKALREHYQQLNIQWQRVGQILVLLGFGWRFWRQKGLLANRSRFLKKL